MCNSFALVKVIVSKIYIFINYSKIYLLVNISKMYSYLKSIIVSSYIFENSDKDLLIHKALEMTSFLSKLSSRPDHGQVVRGIVREMFIIQRVSCHWNQPLAGSSSKRPIVVSAVPFVLEIPRRVAWGNSLVSGWQWCQEIQRKWNNVTGEFNNGSIGRPIISARTCRTACRLRFRRRGW